MVKEPILVFDKHAFVVRLYEDTLEVDLKEGAKKEIEDVVEIHPVLRESLGVLFQTMIPLDIALYGIESAEVDDAGQLRIVIPLRRDIVIPLELGESRELARKIYELIPSAIAKAPTLVF